MEKYYSLNWKDGNSSCASAFAPKNVKLAHLLISDLDGIDKLPFELNLVKLSIGRNGLIESNDLTSLKEIWLDYQPNSLAFPLMSEKLKLLIDDNLTGKEHIDWIACKVKSKTEERPYFILRFNKMMDVLDVQKTMFVEETDRIIRPVFALSKIREYNIFTQPASYDLWKITPSIYVSDTLRKAIQKQKLTGLEFDKTRVE